MYIKVKEKWIYVVDESTNGVEHIYYDEDGNGYYDYEVEETRDNNEYLNLLAGQFRGEYVAEWPDGTLTPIHYDNDCECDLTTNQEITSNISNSLSTASNLESELKNYNRWVDSIAHAQMEMKEVKIPTSGGLFAQINSFSPASVKVISEADLKQMYQPVSKSEPKTRRSKKKKV